MGKRIPNRRGMKRPKTFDNFDTSRHVRKNRRTEEKVARSPSPDSSGQLSEEQSSGMASEEEVVYKEPSMYNNLLKTLGSRSKSVADAYEMRQRRGGGKSDPKENEDRISESLSVSEEEDYREEDVSHQLNSGESRVTDMLPCTLNWVVWYAVLKDSHIELVLSSLPKIVIGVTQRTDSESPRQEPISVNTVEQSEEVESEEFDAEQEHEFGVNGQLAVQASADTSSFNVHLRHKLSEVDVDNLSKKKWEYKWEVPAFDMSNCKWIGTGECFLKDVNVNSDYGLKPRLYKHWLDVYKTLGRKDFHSSKQRMFFSLCNSYRDILHSNKKPFYLKGLEEDSRIMDAYIMHSLNHVFKTRDLVTKNGTKVAKHEESAKEEMVNGDDFLDHGFTRPKVLILLPFASIAYRVVKRLIQLTPTAYKVNVEHFDRFTDQYGTGLASDSEDKNKIAKDVNDFDNSKSQKTSKPSDFQALFGGNNEDSFILGIKFTRRSIKLYSDFYSSDIIVGSPVGLMDKIMKAEKVKETDVDYLSSIEVLIIDHADVIAMQNWDFLKSAVERLNRIPSKQHGTDFMRIRQWYLDGYAKFYRQTIILGSCLNPDMNALFNHYCSNYEGKVKLICEHKGVLPKVLLPVRQMYERFNADSIVDVDDARLEYFSTKVFPKIKDSIQGGIMLFISSYFEYVRIRNFLKAQSASFCLLSEYTKPSDISRARVWFFEEKRKIMLYTERAHFYKRYKIRGIQNLIIYSLPERKEFYPEIVNMLEGSHNMTCTVLFSHFDQLRLERIVGTAPAKRMMTSEKNLFVFC